MSGEGEDLGLIISYIIIMSYYCTDYNYLIPSPALCFSFLLYIISKCWRSGILLTTDIHIYIGRALLSISIHHLHRSGLARVLDRAESARSRSTLNTLDLCSPKSIALFTFPDHSSILFSTVVSRT